MNKILIFTIFLVWSYAQVAYSQNVLPNNGNVGIGTLNPNAKLNVNGKVIVDSSLTVRDTATFESTLRIEENGIVEVDLEVTGFTLLHGDLTVEGDVNLPNLPIGSPDNNILTIDGAGSLRNLHSDEFIGMLYGSNCLTDENGNTTPIWHSTPGNPYGYLYTGDNCPAHVGIGINTPNYEFVVHGDAHVDGSIMIGNYTDPNSAHLSVFHHPSASTNLLVLGHYHPGTQVVDKKFLVTGSGLVYTTEVKVRLSQDFPDYVFKDEYQLLSIAELDSFIVQNGHLPNVPTADQVSEDGLALGEMQRVLLEKIEELTLYIIELNNDNHALKEQLSSLESKLLELQNNC